jgi:hypothetical protein
VPLDRSSLPLVSAIVLAGLALSGCDSFNRLIGKEKVIPDEFAVVSRAPLAIPPDYALRPPRPGAQRDQEETPTEMARQSVFRASDQQPAGASRSPGEGELLREAGAGDTPANIRELVNTDPANGMPLEQGFVDKLLFWKSADNNVPSNQVVDPEKEAERLRMTQSVAGAPTGETPTPVAADGTPIIEKPKSSGWFGWLF